MAPGKKPIHSRTFFCGDIFSFPLKSLYTFLGSSQTQWSGLGFDLATPTHSNPHTLRYVIQIEHFLKLWSEIKCETINQNTFKFFFALPNPFFSLDPGFDPYILQGLSWMQLDSNNRKITSSTLLLSYYLQLFSYVTNDNALFFLNV